jgi:asparagine synthase (glutamine-hydrolysing)
MAHYEHPFYRHHHSVPFFMVCKLVKQHGVKGVLTGEGADECFLGYQFIAQKPLKQRLRRIAPLAFRIRARLAPRDSATMRHVADLLGRFEVSLEKQEIQEVYGDVFGRPIDNNVTTLNLLSHHLRTLLHRNDTMGMAASIEARFPLLSERLVKTAINLPYDAKIRFSPAVWERAHPFLRDKWVLRKVADRYLPKSLSQRKKWPFTVTAYDRMRIPDAYFGGSFVADYFKLTASETAYLLDNADQKLKVKLLMLDVWGRVCLENQPRDRVRERLQAHLAF